MIRIDQLSKRYMLYERPIDRLWDWLTPEAMRRGRAFWALQDVNLEVATGSSMGIVGVNGAGKSTLLKILTGTSRQTMGDFYIEGRVSSLLELGTGFHPEFSGRQNIQFGGKMAGLNEQELDKKFDEIVAFAELGDFIDQPVRTYSSGMLLRLGFALASSVDPDVLIIDEALSVGDLHFQQKCLSRIREFHERGVTVLFVSHDPSMIQKFCTETILLDEGRILDRGQPDQVIDYYTALLAEKYREGGRRAQTIRPGTLTAAGEQDGDGASPLSDEVLTKSGEEASQSRDEWTAPPLYTTGHRTGNFRALITSVYMSGRGAHSNTNIIVTGSPATLHVRWVAMDHVEAATVGIMIRDRLGQEIFGVNTLYRQQPIGDVEAGQSVEVSFAMPMNLGDGLYSVTAAIHQDETHTKVCYDWVDQALSFQVLPDPTERFTGLCRLPVELAVRIEPTPESEAGFARHIHNELGAS